MRKALSFVKSLPFPRCLKLPLPLHQAHKRFLQHEPRLAVNGIQKQMECFQCEQTREQKGCTSERGVCGKTSTVSGEQDLLIQLLKEQGWFADQLGVNTMDIGYLDALFSTLTNVNFDSQRMSEYIYTAVKARDALKNQYEEKFGGKAPALPFTLTDVPSGDTPVDLAQIGLSVGLEARRMKIGNDDVFGLNEMLMYGLKGLSAYADHAVQLGKSDPAVHTFLFKAMGFLLSPESLKLDNVLGMLLKCGEVNLRVLELLDFGHFEKFGKAAPTKVHSGHEAGKCILVSGHDMADLGALLEQTDGTGIKIYTHGEMLPAHSYPELKKYKHLVGHYGGAWQRQKLEFDTFPGPIVMTSNCIIEPRKSYMGRIFTRSSVGWPGVTHLKDLDFGVVIKKAQESQGFLEAATGSDIEIGWNWRSVLDAAPLILDAIKEGKLKRFFLLGGCDGFEGSRSIMTELAHNAPRDSVILTMGCAKYRFNRRESGNVEGTCIPRLIDMGQCNDSFGAIKVALTLSDALKTPVNDLPIHFGISWFEQKAVVVLLTLLHLGVKRIHLGPYLPAFVTPNVLAVLVDKFEIAPLSDAPKNFGVKVSTRAE